MPHLHTVSLTIDFGLLVLIWIVQAVIYPNFHYLEAKAFEQRHRRYTRAMGFIAAPLMIAQLSATSTLLFDSPTDLFRLLHFTLVAFTWITTFLVSVPLHNKLHMGGRRQEIISKLVSTNWARTAAWTTIFGISLADLAKR
ncbi:hypothetical protein [Pelagicoccus sp. SDUM812002]|uniref:hypothetical protein n=1 Tax=Pelagicoccus sp. SDUM812002 TaxID=3041266 RepID=UPI00280C7429|nr:hypothetical protein [Pelagicoccus sp. SDUM812002]MDQ8187002.1 hypothetical protein [Pelagicoccus sp. SDUM812002]